MTSLIACPPLCFTFTFRSLSSFPLAFPLFHLRPSVSSSYGLLPASPVTAIRSFLPPSATSSSFNDSNPKWSNNQPNNAAILLDGCDFQHWLVVVEKPDADLTRDEIIDFYINTLAMVLGSKEEARMKIYSVSTRCYYAFGALVSEELSLKIKELPVVRWVLPDSYLDVKNKDYGGEPFVEGRAVPYDPKYHEEWIRNNQWESERKRRRNERPHNFDRSRNYERRQNMDASASPMQTSNFNNSRCRLGAETWPSQEALSTPSPDGAAADI